MLMPLIGFLAFSGAVSITDFTDYESSQLSRNTTPISSTTATSSNPPSPGPKFQAVGKIKTTAAIRTPGRADKIQPSHPLTAHDNAGLDLQKTLASIEKGRTGTPVIETRTVPPETQKTYFVGNEPGAEPESAWMK